MLIKLMILAVLAGNGLVPSTVSSHTVQPQPRPRSCHARGVGEFSMPDPSCTPGSIDPAVTQRNLSRTICHAWVQRDRPTGASPNPKDGLENHLHSQVCKGAMTLATAQLTISRHWVSAYRAYKRVSSSR